MNKVTVMNIATFEDCCEWLAKTRGKDARDTFEMQVRKIRPLTYLETYDIFEKEIEEKLNDVVDYDSRFD